MEKRKWKNKNLGEAFIHSLQGIKYAFCNERNLIIQVLLAIFAILIGIFLKLTITEWILLSLTIGMVLFAELVNTAIELVLDLYSQKYDETIKRAKDISSGAVLVTSLVSVIVGCLLFLPKI